MQEKVIKNSTLLIAIIFILLFKNDSVAQIEKKAYVNRVFENERGVNHKSSNSAMQDLKRATVFIYIESGNHGSGTLINTVNNSFSNDNRKYFILTATHVIDRDLHLNTLGYIWISFDYESSLSNNDNDSNQSQTTNITKVFKIPVIPRVIQGKKSDIVPIQPDISLLEIVFNESNPNVNENKAFSNAYSIGWDLHPSGPYSNISHPNSDYKKLFLENKLELIGNYNYSEHVETNLSDIEGFFDYDLEFDDPILAYRLRFKKYFFYNLINYWSNFRSDIKGGGSGSGLINARDRLVAVYSEGATGWQTFSALQNAYYDEPLDQYQMREGYLMNFLDPESTWLSSIAGGYINDQIPNPNISFDFNATSSEVYSNPFMLDIGHIFEFNTQEQLVEQFLGDGILTNMAPTNKVYLTLYPNVTDMASSYNTALLNDTLLYGVYYTNDSPSSPKFRGKGWPRPEGEGPILPNSSGSGDSKNIKSGITNYLRLSSYLDGDVKHLSDFNVESILKIQTNTDNIPVRAIKLPFMMPYNAREIFEDKPYKDLWQSYKYKPSRGKASSDLHIDGIKIEFEQYLPDPNGGECKRLKTKTLQTISTGDNGGYLNLVNLNYLIDDIVASEDHCPDDKLNKLYITVKTSNRNNKYYGGWLDYFKNRKEGNQPITEDNYTYNFVEDENIHPEEALFLSRERGFSQTFQHTIPRASELTEAFGTSDTIQTRLRLAIADAPESTSPPVGFLTQDGTYDEGEVEDYLVRIRKSNCDDRKRYAEESKKRKVSAYESINTGVSDCTGTPLALPTTSTISGGQVCHELSGECVDTNTCGNINLTSGNETAWNFNNTDSYIDLNTDELLVSSTSSNLDALTVSFYAYAAQALAPGNTQYLFSLGDDDNGLSIRQNGSKIQLGFATTNTNTGSMVLEAPLPLNQWVNITAVYDGENNPNIASDGVLKLYINNVQVASTNAPNELLFSNQNQVETTFADAANSTLLQNTFTSAPSSNADIVSFDGALANLSIYSEALSAAEIAYFNCETNLPIPSFGITQRGLAPAKTDIKTELNPSDFSIFPNPAKDHLNILVEVQRAGPLDIGIYDQAGRQVYELKKEKISQGHQMITINNLTLATGIYIVKVRAGNVFRSEKLVVE